MGPVADLFDLVARRHLKLNSLSCGVDHLCPCTNRMADRRGCEVPNSYFGADRALAFRNGRIAFSAAFSMARITTGVASTCGSIASLN
jgi:hypothetical protein